MPGLLQDLELKVFDTHFTHHFKIKLSRDVAQPVNL